jgi:uncharacterized protein YidB (DUF937 family)
MTALLGLLAVAGYQNREKVAEMLRNRGVGGSGRQGGPALPGGLEGLLGGLGGGAGGGGLGTILGGGLGEIADRFRQSGQRDTVDSWVGTGPNRNVSPGELEQAIGSDTLDDLMQHTGLSRSELLERLSRDLPNAVDQFTPNGRLPSEDEMRNW